MKFLVQNGRRKICINFQTDAKKVNIVVYCYRGSSYLKHTEMELKLSELKKFSC